MEAAGAPGLPGDAIPFDGIVDLTDLNNVRNFFGVSSGAQPVPEPGGAMLAAIHEALAAGEYSSESWQLLSPELPTLGWWRDWDRCKKLRRAVKRILAMTGGNHRLCEFAKTPMNRALHAKLQAWTLMTHHPSSLTKLPGSR